MNSIVSDTVRQTADNDRVMSGRERLITALLDEYKRAAWKFHGTGYSSDKRDTEHWAALLEIARNL